MQAKSTSPTLTAWFWKPRKWIIAAIILASLFVHAWAIYRLPEDNDEPVYIRAAAEYGALIRAGDLQGVIDYPGTSEHPALVKLIYSAPFVFGDFERDSRWVSIYARSVSAVFGTLTVALVALVDPLAGALLVFHSIFTKYTSLAMLDALPAFTSLAAVLALLRYTPENRRWLWISAAALGLTVAGKYMYAFILIPILVILVSRRDISFRKILLYGGVSLFVLIAANPSLWNDPIRRLIGSAAFHAGYSHGEDVARANFPWYQPFIWLATTVRLHPSVWAYPYLDPLISAAACLGLYFERKRRGWLLIWVLTGLVILLAWPTKWPHYTLIISAPLCLAAAAAFRRLLARRTEHAA